MEELRGPDLEAVRCNADAICLVPGGRCLLIPSSGLQTQAMRVFCGFTEAQVRGSQRWLTR